MKKVLQAIGLLTVLMVMNAVTFLIMFGTPNTRAQEPEQVAIIPGDINCDGGVNLGDAITLLDFLFAEGDAPTVCAQTTDPPPALTKEDLVEALIESRNVFEPRPQDFVRLQFETQFAAECAGDLLLEIPDEEMFVVTSVQQSNALACLVRDGASLSGLGPLFFSHEGNTFLPLFPGDEILGATSTPTVDGTITIVGYWAPYLEETE